MGAVSPNHQAKARGALLWVYIYAQGEASLVSASLMRLALSLSLFHVSARKSQVTQDLEVAEISHSI